jgi:hypothetical protein
MLFKNIEGHEKRWVGKAVSLSSDKKLKFAWEASKAHQLKLIDKQSRYRLNDFILDTLISRQEKNYDGLALAREFAKMEWYYNRGLPDQAHKKLNTVIRKAKDNQDFELSLKAVRWKYILLKEKGELLVENKIELGAIHSFEKQALLELEMMSKARFHSTEFLLMSRNLIQPLDENSLKAYKRLFTTPPFVNPNDFTSLETKVYVNNLKAMVAYNQTDYNKAHKYFLKSIKDIEAHKDLKTKFLNGYFFALNNTLVTSLFTGDIPLYDELLEKVHREFDAKKNFQSSLFKVTFMYEVGINTDLGRYQENVDFENKITNGIERYKLNFINRQIYLFNLAVSFIAVGNFKKASKYLNQCILDKPSKRIKSNSNIEYYAYIIEWILFIERGEFDYAHEKSKRILTDLEKIRPVNKFDSLIIKGLASMTTESKRRETSKELLKQFKTLKADKTYIYAQQIFDFERWLRAKSEGLVMKDVV